jgi:hypothetical protein
MERSDVEPTNQTKTTASTQRKMERAELFGRHSYSTEVGVVVHIWKRDGRYLARGRYQKKPFGVTLGKDPEEADANLRRLLVSIENGAFLRNSEARKHPLKSESIPKLTIRELCNRFLCEKRKLRGKKTAANYQSRLVPLIEFGESPCNRQRWPFAADLDREFAIEFHLFLRSRKTTRNGRPGAPKKPMSDRQIQNVLSCTRTLINWAGKPHQNLLPLAFANPLGTDIVGDPPRKDPLRMVAFSVDARVHIVSEMDAWELSHLTLSMILPLRPEDVTGLLVSEIDFERCLLRFGDRIQGLDFNKGKQQFHCPFPHEYQQILRVCISSRNEGPVLRTRTVFKQQRKPRFAVDSHEQLVQEFDNFRQGLPTDDIQSAQDGKRVFRRFLRELGGPSETALSKGFKALIRRTRIEDTAKFYDLRSSVSTDLEQAGVSHLVQRYVTGHTTSDILNAYVSLDPVLEMRKHFDRIEPLISAITTRANELSLQEC